MAEVPFIVILGAAIGLFCLGIVGSRGLLEIRDALRAVEFDRLTVLEGWLAARALASAVAAMPVMMVLTVATAPAGLALAASALAAGVAFWFAPQILLAARRRVERQVLDDLALHLDLIALAFEAGCGWTAALMSCTERTADGPLRRAWGRVIVEIQAGVEPLEALRGLEQRSKVRPFATLLSAVRAAEKLQQPLAPVLRERARSAAAAKFARAEREARAAPLRLWAAMCLCLLPCTAVVLAFPVAKLLARVWN